MSTLNSPVLSELNFKFVASIISASSFVVENRNCSSARQLKFSYLSNSISISSPIKIVKSSKGLKQFYEEGITVNFDYIVLNFSPFIKFA